MGREEQIIGERIKKVEEMISNGVNPYPHSFDKKNSANDCLKAKLGVSVKTAGRIMTKRDLGKISFSRIRDSTGEVQIVLQDGETGKKEFDFFKKYVDMGDIIGIEGKIIKTKTGEQSILVKEVQMLSKSILPLPEKWHGLQNKEDRYRKRYLDLIMNPEVKNVFDKREEIINAIREYLVKKDFQEVDTPYLQIVYGGASAKPFETHLNSLNMNLFLSISPELYLKRLIVGGYDKVFTIARNFRNEGIDRWHNPEFTMMEIYQAYADYNDMMDLFEGLYEYVAKKVNGSTKVEYRGKTIDFKAPWKRMTMTQAVKKYAKIYVEKMSDQELIEFMEKNHVEKKGDSWGWYVQSIFEHFCEEQIEQPIHIIDHPLETTPLCKLHRKDKMCRLIERFEPFCMGAELGNCYSELNNPILQKTLLEEQQKALSEGDDEAHPYDKDFVNAIEQGMPPTGGLGLGIDRMVMLLTGQDSIRDVILFPFMKEEGKKKGVK
ncbi:MAG: lysine--tRNA ligase [Nanoarchaeota archaeon]|nr:lysine--tRNA ligase [Nanoarchaeota archaeon]